jgi:hypothetical protein
MLVVHIYLTVEIVQHLYDLDQMLTLYFGQGHEDDPRILNCFKSADFVRVPLSTVRTMEERRATLACYVVCTRYSQLFHFLLLFRLGFTYNSTFKVV